VGRKLLIIGWDGADWEIIDDLIARGLMKNCEELLGRGARAKLASTVPSHSWAAWSTFLTGRNPGGHGVFDFVERRPREPDKRVPVTSASIKAPTFLEMLSNADYELRAANIPVTYPPIPIRGRMISGVAIPAGADFVYPKDWAKELDDRSPWPTNGMEWTRFRDDPAALAEEAHRYVENRTASMEVLLEGDWSVAVCVYVAPDRLQHAFGAFLLPSHPGYARFAGSRLGDSIRHVYATLDNHISRLRNAAGNEATVILMSDHGFRPVTRAANLNKILQRVGLATPSRIAGAATRARRSLLARTMSRTRGGRAIKGRVKRPSTIDWARTVAYQSAAGGGVSINLAGREPSGTVDPTDYDVVLDEVRDRLVSFVDEETGGHPIAGAISKESLYNGRHVELAPDLIVEPAEFWALSHTDAITAHSDWPTGAHRRDGVLLAVGDGIAASDLGTRQIADVPATVLAYCGVSPDGLDGEVIHEIVPDSWRERATHERVPVNRPDEQLSQQQQEQIATHLRDLGYIE
jgi:predicted AlkP superfamily phosphohydrolase/phosphomutase